MAQKSQRSSKKSGEKATNALRESTTLDTETATFFLDESSRNSDMDSNDPVALGLIPGGGEKLLISDPVESKILKERKEFESRPVSPMDIDEGVRFGDANEQSPVAQEGAVVPTIFPGDSEGTPRDAQVICYMWKKIDGKQKLVYYMHWLEFNRRLDQLVTSKEMNLARISYPPPDKKAQYTSSRQTSRAPSPEGDDSCGPTRKMLKQSLSQVRISQVLNHSTSTSMLDDESAPATPRRNAQGVPYTGSLSMRGAEDLITRIKNIKLIQISQHFIEPWYFSPYPEDLTDQECIYICAFCLRYAGDETRFHRHRIKCLLHGPPGQKIYTKNNLSFYEIDGKRHREYAQRLCLLAKLFLDHKTLYFDTDPFLFYVLTTRMPSGDHILGFFSKEKESAEEYNVACILTLPQYQKKGYGQLMIDFSYLLTRKEGKTGSPEKPFSDLGYLTYLRYWSMIVLDIIVSSKMKQKNCTKYQWRS